MSSPPKRSRSHRSRSNRDRRSRGNLRTIPARSRRCRSASDLISWVRFRSIWPMPTWRRSSRSTIAPDRSPRPAPTVPASSRRFPPEREVDVGDVAEADQRFGIGAHGVEVDPLCDPVGTGTAAGRDDGSHRSITKRVVEVSETALVPAGHVAPLVERMPTDVDLQAPALQHLNRCGQPRPIRRTRRRDQSNAIATPQH
jgi:hypothetical protein